jgi:AcrR family transcriptional regulator
MSPELPVASVPQAPAERADAARNRERILAVASELVDEHGIEAISIQEIAKSAGVGAGTIYRRFGDRAGLVVALLDEETRELQDDVLRGPPPLGPGAPPVERLKAFGSRYLELVDKHSHLFRAAEGLPEERNGPTAFVLTHITVLLRQADPDLDAEHMARILVAAFSGRSVVHWREQLGWPLERVKDGWNTLVDALTSRQR